MTLIWYYLASSPHLPHPELRADIPHSPDRSHSLAVGLNKIEKYINIKSILKVPVLSSSVVDPNSFFRIRIHNLFFSNSDSDSDTDSDS
jgi:hypothetical protein